MRTAGGRSRSRNSRRSRSSRRGRRSQRLVQAGLVTPVLDDWPGGWRGGTVQKAWDWQGWSGVTTHYQH